MPESDARQYIGNVSGSTELFNNASEKSFDNIYALVEDVNGFPIIAQILLSTPDVIMTAIEKMLLERNIAIQFRYVRELDLEEVTE